MRPPTDNCPLAAARPEWAAKAESTAADPAGNEAVAEGETSPVPNLLVVVLSNLEWESVLVLASAATPRSTVQIPPWLWVLGQVILMTGIAAAPLAVRSVPNPVTTGLAIVLGLVSAGLGLAAAVALGRSTTPSPVPRRGSQLVCHGVYRYLRHPMYTCVLLGAVAWALYWQSQPAGVGVVILGGFFVAKSRLEERLLRQRFPQYAEYAHHTGRFLPRFPGFQRPDPR